MTVKTGQAWAGTFVCLDATGALETGTPAGVLYVDGVANAATVTISGSNPYKFSVTLPSLTAGQRVDMYITATIDTIATASVVASEQADTVLLSDGVVVNSGTVTTLTNLPAVTTDWLTAAGVKADAVTKIQNGLATPTNITAGTITTTTNLTNLPTMPNDWLTAAGLKADAVAEIADAIWDEAIAGHTTVTTFGGKNQKVVPSETINDYKADVSAITGAALSAAGIDAILDEVIIGTYTLRQLMRVIAAKMVGKATGGGTTSITYRGLDDTSDIIVETVDANGNRSAVTLTV
jgi:hypothetical protein